MLSVLLSAKPASFGMALLAGLLLTFAFAPYDYAMLVVLSWLVFLYLLTRVKQTYLHTFMLGFFFGAGLFGFGLRWLFTLGQYFDAVEQMGMVLVATGIILGKCLLCAILAVVLRLTGNLGSRHPAIVYFLLFPALLTLFEWFRTFFLTGFPWFTPADAVWPAASGVLPVAGVPGVNLLLFLVVCTLLYVLLYRRWFSATLVFSGIVGVLALGFTYQNSWTQATGETIQLRLINGNISIREKVRKSNDISNISRYLYLSQTPPLADLVIWPESSVYKNYKPLHQQFSSDFAELSQQGSTVLFGGYYSEKNELKNSIIAGESGKPVYVKRHYIPFGEYLPSFFAFLQPFVPAVKQLKRDSYQDSLLTLNGRNLLFSICFELLFPEELISAEQNMDLHVHVSDLSWFSDTPVDAYMLNIARMRVLEAQKPLAYAVNAGLSAIIDNNGNLLEVARGVASGVTLQGSVATYHGSTPYYRFGSYWLLGMLVALLIACLVFFCVRTRRASR